MNYDKSLPLNYGVFKLASLVRQGLDGGVNSLAVQEEIREFLAWWVSNDEVVDELGLRTTGDVLEQVGDFVARVFSQAIAEHREDPGSVSEGRVRLLIHGEMLKWQERVA